MDLKILYNALPEGLDQAGLKRALDGVLEDDGWLTGSGEGWIELELEDERQNPKSIPHPPYSSLRRSRSAWSAVTRPSIISSRSPSITLSSR